MSEVADHARLMDATYRYQRHVYDATRRFYLLGRDRLIAELAPPEGGTVLEIACGTGRNLAMIRRAHPRCRLHGMDISAEMLRSARAKLPGRVRLAPGDACSFSGHEAFGVARFDRIVMSYCVSMIPDWQAAVANALGQLAPGGELHIVDFGDQTAYPAWVRAGLHAWLARFHVTPRSDLAERLAEAASLTGGAVRCRSLFGDYARYAVVARSEAAVAGGSAAIPGHPAAGIGVMAFGMRGPGAGPLLI